MSELQPGIEAEMAAKLSEKDADMRRAAAGVLTGRLGIVGFAPEAAMEELFRAFPGDGSTISLAMMALEMLQTQKRRTEQYLLSRCEAIIRDRQSDPETVATAHAVLKALEDRKGLLRADARPLADPREMLRPAHSAGYTDLNTLVRAAGNEPGADADPLKENKGGPCDNESRPKPRWQFWKQ